MAESRFRAVLALDTAGPVIGVALWLDGQVTQRIERVARGSETRLVPWARELCAEAGIALQDVDGLGVAVGPGAFTGLRVGLATAVGLAMGLGRPIWACSSLESRAERVGGRVLAMLDARKQRVYAALYDAGQPVLGPADVDPGVALSWPSGPFVATGEGATAYADLVLAAGGEIAPHADDPAVDVLARLAVRGLDRGEGRDPVQIEPVYLREPDAQPPSRG